MHMKLAPLKLHAWKSQFLKKMVTFACRPPYNSNKDSFFKELNKSLSNIIYKKK